MEAAYNPQDDLELEQLVRAQLGPLELEGLLLDVDDGVVYLRGTVPDERDRLTAERLARRVPGVRDVVNDITIVPPGMENLTDARLLNPLDQADVELSHLEGIPGTEPDFNRGLGTTDEQDAADEAEPFFPPTDPVIRIVPRDLEGIEISGGFAGTSMDDPPYDEESAVIDVPRDAEIAEDVRLALQEDAATSDLDVFVYVRNGVVHLRGRVPSLDDAELAEEVAGRIPGVVDVVDELDVSGIEDSLERGNGEQR